MFKKSLLALALAGASMGAHAVAVPWTTGSFAMYNPGGVQMDANDGGPGLLANVTGVIDTAGSGMNGLTASNAGTFTLASTDTFFAVPWSTSNGILLSPGTYTHSTANDGAGVAGGSYTFTVGAGQLGAIIDFTWSVSSGIDVVMVWNVTPSGPSLAYTSTDWDSNGTPGVGMIDGPFPGFSANFNMTAPVPEASTYGMMLAGLGLVGFAARRRKQSV